MTIELGKDAKRIALESIRRFAVEELELELGDLRAGIVLDFFLQEIAPTVYNLALLEAERFLQESAEDLVISRQKAERTWWKR